MNRVRTDVFKGLYARDGAPEGAFKEVSGITTADYPAMKPRKAMSRIGEWENATDVYETDGHMVVIDDNKLYYDGVFKTNVGGTKKQFCEINRKLVVWPDKIYINLNTGEIGNIEAEISGNVTMRDGGILMVSDSSGKGELRLDRTYLWYDVLNQIQPEEEYSYWMRVYSNLSYSNGWSYDSVNTAPAQKVGVGAYFIGSTPQTKYYSYAEDKNWDMDGTVFGRITKITEINKVTDKQLVQGDDGLYYELPYGYNGLLFEYELYDASGLDLGKQFLAGDIVEVQGNTLEYNNQDAVKLTSVGTNQMVVDAAFVTAAKYYNVEVALGPGTYRLVTGTSGGSNTGKIFQTERTIRAGEQLFTITTAGDSGLETSAVYAFDPQTKALEKFASSSVSTYTDLDAKNNSYSASGVNKLVIKRTTPKMEYICEHNNRLYGVSNSEEEKIFNAQTGQYETVQSRVLHASALGQPTRWNVYEGAATDSYAVAVAGEGNFTGIVSYSGNVIAFKEDRMYKLSGDYPAEFYLRSYTVDGVKDGCHKSLSIINEVLYYMSPFGVMSYSGGVPNLVSYDLGLTTISDAVAGRQGTNYLMQMGKLYTYDTIHGLWVSEDMGNVTGIEAIGAEAYVVADGKIYKTGGGTEAVEWFAETHYKDEGTFLHKDYQIINLDVAVQENAEMKVEYRTKVDEPWRELYAVTNYHGVEGQRRSIFNEAMRKHLQLNAGINRADGIQLRFSGRGECKVYAYDRVFRVESDKP